VLLSACTTAPMTNRTSATSITRFRPKASARMDEKGDTRSAKRAVEEVMIDLSVDVSSRPDRDVPMDTSVAEMTPVSSESISPYFLP
jgi:hypothetical protein